MLFALLGLHALAGFTALAFSRRLGRLGLIVGASPLIAVLVWLAVNGGGILAGAPVTDRIEWVPTLDLALDVHVDAFTVLMVVLVSGIGTLVFGYAWSYFGRSVKAGRAAGLLTLFAGSMLGVVLADNLLFLYVCWELTSITSYLLIGIDDEEAEARAAATQALVITGMGGLVMLAGLVLLGQQGGTFRISELLASPPSGTVTSVALVLVLVGAFTKSAQYPFHSWLPGAMVAPTPISAYLHSAAMVKAGVYLVARLAPAFADVGIWRPLVVTVGLTTMVIGGLRALRPFDLKQLLAFGTISQLGFMMVLFGIGQPAATAAGCALLLAHGLFKAALFMVVGVVDHQLHTRDVRRLPSLGRGWTPTKVVAVVSGASMAAVPPLAGFIAKEQAYAALVDGSGGDRLVLAGIVTGSVLTVAYSLRFVAALVRPTLVSEPTATATTPGTPADLEPVTEGAPPSAAFLGPAVLLATATVVLGLLPVVWSDLIDEAAHALDADAHAHLVLWHGFNAALVLSLLTLTAGAVVFLLRGGVARLQAAVAPRTTGVEVYDAIVRSVLAGAGRLTGVVQSGSLPAYAAVILLTAALAPTVALLTGTWWPGWPEWTGSAGQIPIAALLVTAALWATRARRRFAAAVLLGTVGYGMALLFVVQGAPDLALTQFGVETLSMVVFLLVLRKLPDRFERLRPAMGQGVRIAVSVMVGAFVVLMAIAASGARTEAPVSREMAERAYPEGDGRNVVNVILVDIRGIDTMGEITVLVAAAVGITALARTGQGPRRRPSAQERRRRLAMSGRSGGPAGAHRADPEGSGG